MSTEGSRDTRDTAPHLLHEGRPEGGCIQGAPRPQTEQDTGCFPEMLPRTQHQPAKGRRTQTTRNTGRIQGGSDGGEGCCGLRVCPPPPKLC